LRAARATNINKVTYGEDPMYSYKRFPYLFLIILILVSALFSFRAAENPSFTQR